MTVTDDFQTLKDAIRLTPKETYPELLEALVEASYEAGVWKSVTRASDFVRNVEESIRIRKPQYPLMSGGQHASAKQESQ